VSEWQETETQTRLHPVRINGKPTTQEEIRVNADATLGALVRRASTVECGMAETILALLDLLEATQDLVEFQSSKRVEVEVWPRCACEGAAS